VAGGRLSADFAILDFPVAIRLGPWAVHPHLVFELLAYFVGFRLYLAERRRCGDFLDDPRRWWVVAAAAVGAAAGARLLYLLECPGETLRHLADPAFLLGGKTIVGGLAGGWVAVEAAKRAMGVRGRTGDLFAVPLAAAIAVGRIGCFLSGHDDHTHGRPTAVPWGIDLGDGVRRHPTQLYEIAFLALVIAWLVVWRGRGAAPGDLFRGFVASYFGFRLVVDFLKPAACRGLGLSAIQWTCIAALGVVVPDMLRWLRRPGT
jgi:prolipoprotein diacylglyceryltransferase